MSDLTYPLYPVLALFGAVLVLIPLPWHLQAWNSGTCLYMFWTALACLNLGVNSVVWHNTALNLAPVWCDISSRIIVAMAVAIPAASLCINRRLYHIATMKCASITLAEKRRAIIVDLAIGLGIPILQIVAQYIVSGHRFDIFEDIGCYPFTYNTLPAYFLSISWPLAIGVVSAVYCVLTLRAFFRRRAQFQQYLASNASLTTNRYFRLMALAAVELFCTIPITSYGFYLNVSAAPLNPWISWANVHYGYSKVDQYPAILWRSDYNTVVAFGLSTWSAPFCAFVFFGFFGFAEEARRNYAKLFAPLCRFAHVVESKTGIRRISEKMVSKDSSTQTLPTFAPPPPYYPHGLCTSSLDSDEESDYTALGSPVSHSKSAASSPTQPTHTYRFSSDFRPQ